jgi:hypothetical protein
MTTSKLKYLLLTASLLLPQSAQAQAPAQNGSFIPVALWFIGACVLGAVIAYGIMHNRKRSRAEKQITEEATKDNYRREARKG